MYLPRVSVSTRQCPALVPSLLPHIASVHAPLLDTGVCRSVAVITTSNNTADDSARLPALYTTTTAARGINVTPDQITNTQFDSIDGGPT